MLVRCTGCQAAYKLDPKRIPEAGLRVRCPACGNVFRVRTQAPPPPPRTREARVEPSMTMQQHEPRPNPDSPVRQEGELPSIVASRQEDLFPGLQRQKGFPPSPRQPQDVHGFSSSGQQSMEAAPRVWSQQRERTIDFDSEESRPAERSQLETPPFVPGGGFSNEATPSTTGTPSTTVQLGNPDERQGIQTQPGSVETNLQSKRLHERARRLARVLVSDILVYNQEARDRALRQGTLVSTLGPEVKKAWELYKSKVQGEVLDNSDYFKEAINEILADGQKVF